MAGPDPTPLRRRFVTRVDVEDAHRAGQGVTLSGHDVITHEAAQRAADLGVPVTRPDRGTTPAPPTTPSATAPSRDERLRDAVRAAVVAELGHAPDGLDDVIDRVLARRD
jgi:hypothetical protein